VCAVIEPWPARTNFANAAEARGRRGASKGLVSGFEGEGEGD
jgi:hypothetical protein